MRPPSRAHDDARPVRGAATVSLATHALVLASLIAWQSAAEEAPREAEAQIQVVFGTNADVSAAPTPVTAVPAPTAEPSPAQPPVSPPVAVAPARPSGGKVGLLVTRPDPNMVEAQADPGNRAPKYPDGAWIAREQGEVVLRLHIDPDGRVSRTELRRSSGHGALDQAAMAALSRWRFVPALRDGVPVPSYRDQATDFELEGGR